LPPGAGYCGVVKWGHRKTVEVKNMIWRGLIFSLIVLQGSALPSLGRDPAAPPPAPGNARLFKFSAIAAGWSAWQRDDSKGTFTWDRQGGAAGKGAARASRIADGCFLQSYKVAPGERYAVRATCKVHGAGNAWLRVRWQTAEGRWTAETQDQLCYCEASPDNWRELFGVVEVPEGVGRLLVLLGVGGQSTAEDVIWFDDVELYRF
jgi:hypothetical protein